MVGANKTGEPLNGLCAFDADTLACSRCGYVATKLPHYRYCQTLLEKAESIANGLVNKRIRVPPLRVGTAIGRTLARVGITPLTMKKITGRDCGCKERANKLDAAGAAVSAVVERAANAALQVVLPAHVDPSDVAAIANTLHASPLTNAGLKQGPPA